MDSLLIAQLGDTFFGTALGWWVAHRLSSRRNIEDERRKLRMQYLLEAYRRLEGASHRANNARPHWSALESAVADIQLLGSPHQVRLANKFCTDIARDQAAPLDELLNDLRNSVRLELNPGPITGNPQSLRFYEIREKD